MRWHIWAMGDTHAGSTTGLVVGDSVPHPEGMTIGLTPTSAWLQTIYRADARAFADHAEQEGASIRTLVLMGDLTDGGMHHGTVELYHPDAAVEKHIARTIVADAIETYQPDLIFMVHGTPSHVGGSASREESIGAFIEGEYPGLLQRPRQSNRYGWGVLRANWGGVVFDCRHHGKMGLLPHTRESYHKRYAFDVWSSQAMYRTGEPAAVALRAHKHKYADSGPVAPHKNGTRVISLPCYQMGGEWVRKMAFEEAADIGSVGIVAQDGRLRDVLARVTYPQMWEDTWTAA